MPDPSDLEFVPTPPPVEEGVDDLPAPPRRRASRITAATVVLALASMGAIGFALGVVIEKHQLPKTNQTQVSAAASAGARAARGSTTTVAGGAAGAGGGGAGGGGGGGGGGFGGGLIGQVAAVDGTTLTVTEANGNVAKVTIAPTSAITRTNPATAADIKSGDYVTVQGAAGTDGTTTANRIVDSGATPPAVGRGGGAGGGGAGGSTGTGPAGSRPFRTTTVP